MRGTGDTPAHLGYRARARVAISRAHREANNKYTNKQTLKEDETSNDIKKEDAATTHQASQTGCQDAGSGPVSSKSIPIRELVPHHEGHGLSHVQGSVGALARVEASQEEQAPGVEG